MTVKDMKIGSIDLQDALERVERLYFESVARERILQRRLKQTEERLAGYKESSEYADMADGLSEDFDEALAEADGSDHGEMTRIAALAIDALVELAVDYDILLEKYGEARSAAGGAE